MGGGLKEGLWLCPSSGIKNPATKLTDFINDQLIRSARTIVERTYQRIKGKFTIFDLWIHKREQLMMSWTLGAALVNIDIATGYPLNQECLDNCKACYP